MHAWWHEGSIEYLLNITWPTILQSNDKDLLRCYITNDVASTSSRQHTAISHDALFKRLPSWWSNIVCILILTFERKDRFLLKVWHSICLYTMSHIFHPRFQFKSNRWVWWRTGSECTFLYNALSTANFDAILSEITFSQMGGGELVFQGVYHPHLGLFFRTKQCACVHCLRVQKTSKTGKKVCFWQ